MKERFMFIMMLTGLAGCQTNQDSDKIVTRLGEKEYVWAGIIMDGYQMPFSTPYSINFYGENKRNQVSPLILTSEGKYFWSEEPFSFQYSGKELIINDPKGKVQSGQQGNTLAEAQKYVREHFFPASGLMPDSLLFTAPQYNTWIELNLNQNQEDVIKYARAIIDNGLPAGVFMIDDTWQEDYGIWDFHPKRFPNPKLMVDHLHAMGFKVMLWICPFVSADQSLLYHKLAKEKAFLLQKTNVNTTWENAEETAMIPWWNGVSALLDFSNPAAVKWFNDQLDRLVSDYHIDGFKLDAGDMRFYPENTVSKGNFTPNQHCESFTQFGLRFPLNEYRACWKMGGKPLGQRLHDKGHTWEDLQTLIPDMVVEGLSGYTFSCPDMIGGGLLDTFEDSSKINQELIVRSAQCHALMPMMQFSVAPWRVLDKINFNAVKKAVEIRKLFTPLIMELARKSAQNGEPVMTNLEYYFPNQGFATIKDQFMLGDQMMVAPMVEPGNTRKVIFPQGEWKGDDEKSYQGGQSYEISVPTDRLPYFVKKQK
jgi:alpha-glucosidase (family GH31 glycosyl hydrolase)